MFAFPFSGLVVTLSCLSAVAIAAPVTITSPSGQLEFTVTDAPLAANGSATWSLRMAGQPMVNESPLGLMLGKSGNLPAPGWKMTAHQERKVSDTWKPQWGKRAVVPDCYTESTLTFTGTGAFDTLQLVVRAYDDGVAFRYIIPENAQGEPQRAAERTEFRFAGDFTAWFYNGESHNLGPDKLSAVKGARQPVMLLKAADDAYLAVHEADLRVGEPMKLTSLQPAGNPTSFMVSSSAGQVQPGFVGPWRVVFAGKTPGVLVDSHLLELLNPPAQGDFSWVKPGVAVWDWRIDGAQWEGFKYEMSLPSWKRMVDFAAENHIRHLVLDANWYGEEFSHTSDPVKGGKAADVREIIRYGKEKNVGVWLYLNDVGGRKYPLEQTLKKYGEWGASGVKYGFMNGAPEEKNTRTRMITELCAKNHLLCDFHDGPVHPYGQMRTWPNAVTREFCWAQLDGKKPGFGPKTFVTSVFVNMLAGPLDMNNGMFDLRQGKSTRADNNLVPDSTVVAEAARTQIVFSGAIILPDIPEYYRKYPQLLEFIAAEQMPWRESRTLSGAVGEFIVMARQAHDGAWLVGAATDEKARSVEVGFDFLGEGSYEALIIEDGEGGHYQNNRESWKHRTEQVTNASKLTLKLAPGGGACVLIRKK